jgi:hypothetical protein
MSMSNLCLIDDKHVPLYRVIWVSDLPHFCGEAECEAEGRYEVRLEQNESLFASLPERDQLLKVLSEWTGGIDEEPFDDEEEEPGGKE